MKEIEVLTKIEIEIRVKTEQECVRKRVETGTMPMESISGGICSYSA